MIKTIILACSLVLIASCQSNSINTSKKNSISSEAYQAQIKVDKKKQAEIDVPFRSFTDDKKIETIAFGNVTTPQTPALLWNTLSNNNPELILVTTQPNTNYTSPEYRSTREKIPFMANWSNYDFNLKYEAKNQFIRNWPYVKTLIPTEQDGFFHAKTFGSKKNIVQVLMLEKNNTTQQMRWLESELKKTAQLRILSMPALEKPAVLNLVQKMNIKNIIILPNTNNSRSISSAPDDIIPNFGLIKINWPEHIVHVQIKSITNETIESQFTNF